MNGKTLLEKRGMKANVEKTKVMALGRSPSEKKGSGQTRYPCSICSKGVGSNSINCRTCDLWYHKRCSGLQSLKRIEDTFELPYLQQEDSLKSRTRNATVLGWMEANWVWLMISVTSISDVMSCDSGAEKCCKSQDSCRLEKNGEKLLDSWSTGAFQWRTGQEYNHQACIRPVLLYGGEAWPITKWLEQLLWSCDFRVLRYMAKIRWEDRISNERGAEDNGGLEEISSVLKKRET